MHTLYMSMIIAARLTVLVLPQLIHFEIRKRNLNDRNSASLLYFLLLILNLTIIEKNDNFSVSHISYAAATEASFAYCFHGNMSRLRIIRFSVGHFRSE